MRGVLTDLVELVFPADCPGCGAAGPAVPLCARCAHSMRARRAGPVRPVPAPTGLPPCAALGAYRGVLRQLLLGYKERGRLALAGPLGAGLAAAVLAVAPAARDLILVPVPASAAAARARGGDHVRRLARRAARELTAGGRRAVVRPALVAAPRMADSTTLTAAARARRARAAFRSRRAAMARLAAETATRRGPDGPTVVLVDDIITTGSTIAAVGGVLRSCGVPVAGAAALAATRRRRLPYPVSR